MAFKLYKYRYIYVVLALVLLAVSVMGGRYISSAFADTPQYTNALTDLQKDSEFNVADYPDNAKDYSIRFIQIAESTDKELFVYTYQPSQKTTYLVATEINMSLSESVDGTLPYGLTLINSDGVFCKYKVNGVTVSSDVVRYYNITSIYRDWMKGIDKETGNDNIVNGVAFSVGRKYTVITSDGKVTYDCSDIEVVKIENKWNSAIIYPDGFKSLCDFGACTSHFVAFTSDRKIDALLEADVSFVKQPYTAKANSVKYSMNPDNSKLTYTYGDSTTERVTLHYDDIVQNDGNGFYGEKHIWNRIESVETFKKNNTLNDNAIKQLENKQWVLRYYESERTAKVTNGGVVILAPIIGMLVSELVLYDERTTDVTILRLEFETDGKLYNLGVVDNKQTGNGFSNVPFEFSGLFEWLERVTGVPQWVWILIAILVPIAILLPVLFVVFPAFGSVVLATLKGLLRLVCLPFKGIAALIRKINERRGG